MNIAAYKETLQSNGALAGRILIALLFVSSGASMLMGGIGGTAMYFESLSLPVPMLLAVLVIAVKIIGGLCVMVGYRTEEAAAALFVFTGLTIAIAHLDVNDTGLWKNLSIMGGLLYVMAFGPGNGWKLNLNKSDSSSSMKHSDLV